MLLSRVPSAWPRLRERLFAPVDGASLVVFRMMFGAVLFWEVWRYFDRGWIEDYYILPEFHFKYLFFEWVHPWPGNWMYVHFVAVGVLALCVMLGVYYRVTSVLLWLGFTYWFLLDVTNYLNHLFLVGLLTFLMMLLPVHRACSFDAWRRPDLRTEYVPTWALWLMRFQVGVVYFYAGVAKLNADWLRAEPIRSWLDDRSHYPLIGPLLDHEWAAWCFAYGGLLFDLLIAPALLWRRTRVPALLAAVFFHTMNKWLFSIGIFPVLAMAATLVLLSPDWPRKLLLFFPQRAPEPGAFAAPSARKQRVIAVALALWFAFQVLMPLRHFLYPGSVHWTEEGHLFSWHMKLRDKAARARFFAREESGRTWEIDASRWLTARQLEKVGAWPDLCLQFAHHAEKRLREEGYGDLEIMVRGEVSLNRRYPQYLVDPDVDLTSKKRGLRHRDWLVPLIEPLRRDGSDDGEDDGMHEGGEGEEEVEP